MSSEPYIRIPDKDELHLKLSVSVDIDERVRYVLGLLTEATRAARAIHNLSEAVQREKEAKESMAAELKALRVKVGELNPAERTAAQARYEMLQQIKQARARLDRLEQEMKDAVREMRAALAK